MKITKISANKNAYNSKTKRQHSDVKFIIIHYTGNIGDTAENNGKYFRDTNTRAAGAHFFIDQKGNIIKSVDINRVAWSVGGSKYSDCEKTGGGKFYGIATNGNSVSIELCDNATNDPSEKQIAAVVQCVKYIRKYCKNANYLIRHFDVNGKHCPARMIDSTAAGRKKWIEFKARVYKDAGMAE